METSLHRQLKSLFADDPAAQEVRIDGFRIDAVVNGELIEIQQASLSALRTKVKRLLERHAVRVVKPLFARKRLVQCEGRTHLEISRRWSPTRQSPWDLFLDLVHFCGVFPHPRLTLEIVLVEIEERRVGRQARRWKGKDYRVLDRTLLSVQDRWRLRKAGDLRRWLPASLPREFTTEELALATGLPRWWAQKIAYCLRETGAVQTRGKRARAWLYRQPIRRAA